MRKVVASIDADIPMYDIRTMEQVMIPAWPPTIS